MKANRDLHREWRRKSVFENTAPSDRQRERERERERERDDGCM